MSVVMSSRRPQRADARRNYDALLKAARNTFTELGTDAPLEEIARRAGVGIATLYRNFPTREQLIEDVYIEEVEAVAAAAEDVQGREPWDAFAAWLGRFLEYAGTKRVLIDALNRDSPGFKACRGVLGDAGGPLLERAQAAGAVRADVNIDDLLRLLTSVAGGVYVDTAQRDRVVSMMLDGLRTATPTASVS